MVLPKLAQLPIVYRIEAALDSAVNPLNPARRDVQVTNNVLTGCFRDRYDPVRSCRRVRGHPTQVEAVSPVERLWKELECEIEDRYNTRSSPRQRQRVYRPVEKCDAIVIRPARQDRLFPRYSHGRSRCWPLGVSCREAGGCSKIDRVLSGSQVSKDAFGRIESPQLTKKAVDVPTGTRRVVGLAGGELLGVDADAWELGARLRHGGQSTSFDFVVPAGQWKR